MTEPMCLLYDHVLETSFASNLRTAKYRLQETHVKQLARNLRDALPAEALPLLDEYLFALDGQQLMELEVMFQAAFTLPGELR